METKIIPLEYRETFLNEIEAGLQQGIRLTARFFLRRLEDDGIVVSMSKLLRKLKEWHISYGRLLPRDIRRRREFVIIRRAEYLKEISRYKELGYDIVYLDESFLHENTNMKHGWHSAETGTELFTVSGSGRRIAIIASITNKGWLGVNYSQVQNDLAMPNERGIHSSGSIRYWLINNKKKDQGLGNFDSNSFFEYFSNQVVPYLNNKSVLVLDNAGYHKMLSEGCFKPTAASKKSELIEFLNSKKIVFNETAMKAEILALAKKEYQTPKTKIELLAEEHGFEIFYLPPYHPELNPIENGWGQVKKIVAEAASFDVTKICFSTLPKAFRLLSSKIAQNLFSHVENEEQRYQESNEEALIEVQKNIQEDLNQLKIRPSRKFLIDEDAISVLSEESSNGMTDISYHSEFTNEYNSE